MEAHTMKYAVEIVDIPDRPDVIKLIITTTPLTLVNRSAAPDAKIIWLLQRPDDVFPAPVLF